MHRAIVRIFVDGRQFMGEGRQVHRLVVDVPMFRVFGQQQQLLGHFLHANRFGMNGVNGLLEQFGMFATPPFQQMRIAFNHRKGSFQFMGGVRHELLLPFHVFLQQIHHVVERSAHDDQFIAGFRFEFDPFQPAASLDVLHRLNHGLDGAGDEIAEKLTGQKNRNHGEQSDADQHDAQNRQHIVNGGHALGGLQVHDAAVRPDERMGDKYVTGAFERDHFTLFPGIKLGRRNAETGYGS